MNEVRLNILNGNSCDRYRKAARDGNLLILKEATKRDLNAADEDGMSAVHWAAYDGRLEALRIITGRGGNPDTLDLQGQTALHQAVRRNHLHCVSFLINFGSNVWALDDDGHSALDLAGILGHDVIMRYLDSELACRYAYDKKAADKCKLKAKQELERRIRRKELDLRKRLANLEINDQGISRNARNFIAPKNENGTTEKSIRQKVLDTLTLKSPKKDANGKDKVSKCATVPNATNAMAMNKRRCQSMAEISKITSKNVLFGKPVSAIHANDSTTCEKAIAKPLGLFERPGFGSVSFRNLQVVAMFQTQSTSDEDNLKENPADCPMQEFLLNLGLQEFYAIFRKEKITMDSLKLLNENDLTQLGLPMGPRKLLLDAINNHAILIADV